jgi:hypothetical protein
MDEPARYRSQEPGQKTNRFRLPAAIVIVLMILVGTGLYTWYYRVNACDTSAVKETSTFLSTQLKTYDAAFQFATTVYGTGLSRPVNDLQKIYMDTQEVGVPACLQTAKKELLSYMGTVINAFQAYMAEQPDTTIRGYLNQSNTYYDHFKWELEAVNQCTPYCAPWD